MIHFKFNASRQDGDNAGVGVSPTADEVNLWVRGRLVLEMSRSEAAALGHALTRVPPLATQEDE